MTVCLASDEYQAMWQHACCPTDAGAETVLVCSSELGTGRKRWVQLRDIVLLIHDYQFAKDLLIHYPPEAEDEAGLEFGFQLSGIRSDRQAGQNFLYGGDCEGGGLATERSSQRVVQVDIHLSSIQQLCGLTPNGLEGLPKDLQQIIESNQSYDNVGVITPEMRTALDQLLNCPYAGLTRQLYLESRCLELIALKLEQLSHPPTSAKPLLKPDDIDRIHLAKQILIARCDRPPSLIELARQVSLNDYKLKVGFRQVFGTTVFGYLHQHRMETAQQLLRDRRMNVKEVARAVGYANQSRFAAAFRKRFGVNPKQMFG